VMWSPAEVGGTIKVWGMRRAGEEENIYGPLGSFEDDVQGRTGVAFSQGGDSVCTTRKGAVTCWDVMTGQNRVTIGVGSTRDRERMSIGLCPNVSRCIVTLSFDLYPLSQSAPAAFRLDGVTNEMMFRYYTRIVRLDPDNIDERLALARIAWSSIGNGD